MKKYINYLFFILFVIVIFVSCEKDNIAGMDEMKDKAKVIFINATPNAATVASKAIREIAIYPNYNGMQFNNFPIKFPWSNGYKAFNPGTLTIRLDTARSIANDPPGAAAKVMEFPIQVQSDSYYSLFSVGTVQKVDTFLIKDNLALPSSGKAKILFLNLSTDAGAIDIVNSVNGLVVAANISYKQRTKYIEVDPGLLKYQINQAGTSTILKSSRDLIIDANSVYTVWARGLKVIPVPGSTISTHPLQLSYHANRWSY